jgi:hypothetical protein
VVAVSAPVDVLLLVGSAPFQPPEAVHEVAFVELQLMVEVLPPVMLVGDALSDTVGPATALAPREQAASASEAAAVRPAATKRLKYTCHQEELMSR